MSTRERNATNSSEDLYDGDTVVVAGGTGNVGRVLADALLRAGATVVVPSRSEEKLEELRAHLSSAASDRLVIVPGDIGDERKAPDLVERIAAEHGPVRGAVATLGRFVPAPSLLEASADALEQVIEGYLISHFVAARSLIPRIEDGGSYTFINGPLAFRPMNPAAGLVSTVTAAQAMLARVLMDQVEAVRVNELVLYTPFGWGEDAEKNAPVSQDDVGRAVAHLASPRAAHLNGETIHLDSSETLRELVPGE